MRVESSRRRIQLRASDRSRRSARGSVRRRTPAEGGTKRLRAEKARCVKLLSNLRQRQRRYSTTLVRFQVFDGVFCAAGRVVFAFSDFSQFGNDGVGVARKCFERPDGDA